MTLTVNQASYCYLHYGDDITNEDYAKLRDCEGMVVFLPTFQPHGRLSDVSLGSYRRGGNVPDALTLLAEFHRRLPAVIFAVEPRRVILSVLEMSTSAALYKIRNTGPFEWVNGDRLALVPPLLGPDHQRVTLPSLDLVLIFPLVVPEPLARELMCKVAAGTLYEYSRRQELPTPPKPDSLNHVTYRGRRVNISAFHTTEDVLEGFLKNLMTVLMFGVHEGLYLLLSFMPQVLSRENRDVFTNTLLQLQNPSRLALGTVRPPFQNPEELDGGPAGVAQPYRDNAYEMLRNYLALTSEIRDLLNLDCFARVVDFNSGTNVVREGELARCARK